MQDDSNEFLDSSYKFYVQPRNRSRTNIYTPAMLEQLHDQKRTFGIRKAVSRRPISVSVSAVPNDDCDNDDSLVCVSFEISSDG